jgi:sigma-B regulation protein RsbU (phosphoserine phosphatase)
VLKLDEETVAVCIADVCGKGMPAAMVMSNLQAAVKTCAARHVRPRELCERVNRVMCANLAGQGFITFFYAELTRERLVYCNAGHNPPLARLRTSTAESRLSAGGGVLGLFSDWAYDEAEVQLASGDCLLLYTDGITEGRNSEGEEYGEDRLSSLVQHLHRCDAKTLADAVLRSAADFTHNLFDDDLTVVAVSVD